MEQGAVFEVRLRTLLSLSLSLTIAILLISVGPSDPPMGLSSPNLEGVCDILGAGAERCVRNREFFWGGV